MIGYFFKAIEKVLIKILINVIFVLFDFNVLRIFYV